MVLTVILMPYYLNTTRFREIELVFVVDTTGSMAGEIEELKKSMDSIATALQRMSKNLRLGIVQYKDRGYENSGVSSSPLVAIPRISSGSPPSAEFTNVVRYIGGLEAGDGGFTGANNTEGEAMLSGIEEMRRQQWSSNPPADSRQVVFLIGDDWAHPDERERVLAAVRGWIAAGEKTRTLTCIYTGSHGSTYQEFFQEVAKAGNGKLLEGSNGLLAAVLDEVLVE